MQLKQVAKLLGADPATVINWESGRRKPAIRHLPKVIEFLGCDPRPTVEAIGQRLKRHREACGWSQSKAASMLGVDPSVLGRWESGQRQPQGKYLAKAHSFLGEDPPPVPATVADRLKRCREALGWSQRELARRIGVWPSTVERWELGHRRPGAEHAAMLERLEDLANGRA